MLKGPKESTTDTWLTPPWILEALGDFDLDPAAAPIPRPWSTARQHYTLSKGEDGLKLPWQGRIWCNPPYSTADPWCAKMAAHNNGILCVAVRAETQRWIKYVFGAAQAILLLTPRVTFMTIDGKGTYGNVNQTALVAYGEHNKTILTNCGLQGVFLDKWAVKQGVTKRAKRS